MKRKKWAAGILSGTAAAALIIVLLLSAFEAGVYGDFDFYEREYEKHLIQRELPMEMDDIMDVTKKMMAYLKGDREELSVQTMIGGVRQDFFNEQDRFHMAEVKDLFLGGFALRRCALFVLGAAVMGLILLKGDIKKLLPKAYEIAVGAFLLLAAVFGIAIVSNFEACFVRFHELFFDNDLWMFDPAEDYMIRMLPEGFFFDMTVRIVGIFVGFLLVFLFLSLAVQFLDRKNQIRKTYK